MFRNRAPGESTMRHACTIIIIIIVIIVIIMLF